VPGAKVLVRVTIVPEGMILTFVAKGRSATPPALSRAHTPASDALTAGEALMVVVAVTLEPLGCALTVPVSVVVASDGRAVASTMSAAPADSVVVRRAWGREDIAADRRQPESVLSPVRGYAQGARGPSARATRATGSCA